MAYLLKAHTKMTPGANGGTTSAIDTTGADILFIVASRYGLGSEAFPPSDNKGNTWQNCNQYQSTSPADATMRIWYAKNAIVGSGHTFTYSASSCYPQIDILAFSGSLTSSDPVDQQNGAAGTGFNVSTLQTGSVTPSQANELLVTGMSINSNAPGVVPTIDSGFTVSDADGFGSGNNMGGGAAYLIQTAAAAVNPTWSLGIATANPAAAIATFKAVAAPTGKLFRPAPLTGLGVGGPFFSNPGG